MTKQQEQPMNNRQKGRANELRAKKQLEAEGYDVVLAPMPTRYSKQNDMIHGLWDIIAFREDYIRFIQVKSNKSDIYGKKLQAHRDWDNYPPNCFKECWLYTKGYSKPEVIILSDARE